MVDFAPKPLSRIVPAHTRTIRFNWCKADFMLFGFYKGVREKRRMSIQSACFWCRVPFNDEDMMALAQPESGANKLLCQSCAGQITAVSASGEPRG